jgi:hypothetical protein
MWSVFLWGWGGAYIYISFIFFMIHVCSRKEKGGWSDLGYMMWTCPVRLWVAVGFIIEHVK